MQIMMSGSHVRAILAMSFQNVHVAPVSMAAWRESVSGTAGYPALRPFALPEVWRVDYRGEGRGSSRLGGKRAIGEAGDGTHLACGLFAVDCQKLVLATPHPKHVTVQREGRTR